jgi:UMF1 family MFS transporter
MTDIATPGRDSSPAPRLRLDRRIVSWALWDAGSAAVNAVMTTFVFTVYLTSSLFGDPDRNTASLSTGMTITGVVIALVAPVLGLRSDRGGRRKFWLAVHTGIIVVSCGLCFLVQPSHAFLWLGIILLCMATLGGELASVNYYAMLPQISSPATMGRVSGFGWSFGYFGGILALALVLFLFVQPVVDWPGGSDENGLNLRLVAVFCAVWTLGFSLPVFFAVPEVESEPGPRRSILGSYVELGRVIARFWREDRPTLYFLGAQAVYRDGLAAVFTFGGVIAGTVFGMSQSQVIVFAIAGNIVAALGALTCGWLEDRVGPRAAITTCLMGLVLTGFGIFFSPGPAGFWVFGLIMCALVGPAQSSSRSLLARRATPQTSGELFGLYTTTGRAVSFLAPALFTLGTVIATSAGVTGQGSATRFGVLGIVVVLALGLVLFWLGRDRRRA